MRGPQGKVAELRFELNSGGKKDKHFTAKKIALKKIVANMTMSNNDMVALFPDIVGCMNIPSLEIKKMCFLFLVNYARMRPDVSVKAIPVLQHVSSIYPPYPRRRTRWLSGFVSRRVRLLILIFVFLGHGRSQPPCARSCATDNVLHSCTRIRRGDRAHR